jgi:transcriptional regulator with XRE-family HTH domain
VDLYDYVGTVQVDLDGTVSDGLDLNAIDWDGLPARIRNGLSNRELSQRQFAQDAGVSLPAVHHWLKGARIKPERWPRVARALGLSVEELLGAPTADPPAPAPSDVTSPQADALLTRLAELSGEPFDQAIPDLIEVLRDAQAYAETRRG